MEGRKRATAEKMGERRSSASEFNLPVVSPASGENTTFERENDQK